MRLRLLWFVRGLEPVGCRKVLQHDIAGIRRRFALVIGSDDGLARLIRELVGESREITGLNRHVA